jgi:hypothetical protein
MSCGMNTRKEIGQRYRSFTGKLAAIYGLEPKEKYFCSLVKSVAFNDLEVAMDIILEGDERKERA